MSRFADMPIKRKLTLVILPACIGVVLLAGVALVATEMVSFLRSMGRDMTVLADVIGRNSAAAVQFADDKAGKENLSALQAEEHVIAAALYGKDNNRIA